MLQGMIPQMLSANEVQLYCPEGKVVSGTQQAYQKLKCYGDQWEPLLACVEPRGAKSDDLDSGLPVWAIGTRCSLHVVRYTQTGLLYSYSLTI